MVNKIILELPADTVGGDILVSTETRYAAEAARDEAVLAAENSGNLVSASASSVPASQPAKVTLSGPLDARSAAFEIPRGADGSNVLPTDTAIAQAISTPGSETQTQLNATFAPMSMPEFAPLMRKLELGTGDAALGILSDSTWAAPSAQIRPARQVALSLSDRYPEFTVVFVTWDTSTTSMLAPETISIGTGTHTLTIFNGAHSGGTTLTSLTYLGLMLPATPDAVIINHGLNMASGNILAGLDVLIRTVLKKYPSTTISLVSQNPKTTASASYADQLDVRRAIGSFAAREGFGLIDATKAFLDYPGWEAALMVGGGDDTHPNQAGYNLIAQLVLSRLTFSERVGTRTSRRPVDRIMVSAGAFLPRTGTPEIVTGQARAGWALDSSVLEGISVFVDLPYDWAKVTVCIFWTTIAAPGGNGPGVVSLTPSVSYDRLGALGQPSATFPVGSSGATTTFGSGATLGETVPNTGELGAIRRRLYLAGTANELPAAARGPIEFIIERNGNSGGDTLAVDAIILGVMFERVE